MTGAPHPLSMGALIARRAEHRNAPVPPAEAAPVALEPEVEPVAPPAAEAVPLAIPAPTPWATTGRTREAGRTLDMATGRPVPRVEREYSRVVDGATETVWTSTGAPTT